MLNEKKFKGKIEAIFEGDDITEVRKRYDDFSHTLKNYNYACLTPPRENEKDKGIINDIIGNLFELFFKYEYTIEDLRSLLEKLSLKIEDEIDQEIKLDQADLMYDIAKEQEFMVSLSD